MRKMIRFMIGFLLTALTLDQAHACSPTPRVAQKLMHGGEAELSLHNLKPPGRG
jgi:hypothetical protein